MKKFFIDEHLWCFILVCILFGVSIFCSQYSSFFAGNDGVILNYSTKNDPCSGLYIYIHDLPSKFNDDILKYWSNDEWFKKSKFSLNAGFGPRVNNSEGVLQEKSWYSTDQFTLEIIFHNKLKNYKCLTKNSALASAIYVPFYAGIEVRKYLWSGPVEAKDALGIDLMKWLLQRREWEFMSGRDHFFVAGRVWFDFGRKTEYKRAWGSNLMSIPGARNMTMLTIESGPWSDNEYGIPYPSYFHPSSESEILDWQNNIRGIKRQYLYSFVGAPRPQYGNSIRGKIIEQCIASKEKCEFLNCNSVNCDDPTHVMKMFKNSTFCLQPPGDSPTRRSTFDSILAGCIPVFFNLESAYNQYVWHFSNNYTKYSVFISEDDVRNGKANIETILLRKLQNESEVLAIREEVIRLIPKVTYSSTRSKLKTWEDAFDITIEKVLGRVGKIRKLMKEGNSSFDLSDNHRIVNISKLN